MKEKVEKSWEILLSEDRKINIDVKDLKILDSIINNSRTTLSEINKITKLSKPSIINRINKLKSLNIISNPSCFIDFLKLGVDTYHIEIKTGLSIIEKEKYINYLKKNFFINQITSVTSKDFDLMIRVLDPKNNIDQIVDYISKYKIIDINIFSVQNIFYRGLDLFNLQTKDLQKKDISFKKTFNLPKIEMKKFDKKDINLLYLLSKDSSQNLIDLSTKLKIAKDTLKNKLIKLIRSKTILRLFYEFDIYKLGLSPYFLKLKILKRNRKKELFDYLLKFNRCHGIIEHKENWNILASLSFKDRNELAKFEKNLLERFEEIIHEYEFIIVNEQIKYDLFPKKIKDVLLSSAPMNLKTSVPN